MHHIVVLLLVGYCHVALAQSYPFIGARANALGYASSCLSDEWSVFNNPAGASDPENPMAAATADLVPEFKPWNRMAAVYLTPFLKGGLNVGVWRTGDHVYSEQMITAAYANTFGITSLGISAQLIQYNAEGFGSRSVPSVSLGGITTLYPWLTIGACIVNLTQAKITEGERIPTILIAGAALKLSDNVTAFAEAEKNIAAKPLVRAAIEYQFNKNFSLRTGFHPAPSAGYFGFGFRRSRLMIDYAFSYMQELGIRHQSGIAYRFIKRK